MIKQKIAVFDIDGTIFRIWLFREVLTILLRQDLLPLRIKDEFDFSQYEYNWLVRKSEDSFDDYNDKMVATFLKYAHLIKIKDLEKASEIAVKQTAGLCYSYSLNLAKRLQRQGYFVLLISGSFEPAVRHFAEYHGLDGSIGLEFLTSDEYLSSNIKQVTFKHKDKVLLEWIDTDRFTLKDSYGVGDTTGDSELLDLVENPIAFNPNKGLADIAVKKRWPMIIERKNLITRLQADESGELKAEFINLND